MSSTPKSFQVAEPADRRYTRVEPEVSPVLLSLLRNSKYIAALTVAAFVISALYARFVMRKWYRAEAVLRPIFQLMPSGVGSTTSSPISFTATLLGSTMGTARAQEITTIMQSFDFSLAMVQRHHLQDELLSGATVWGWAPGSDDPQWRVFRLLQNRFSADFSLRSGNVTLSYLDSNRATAQRILGYYIGDLREKLREEQIRNTGAAISSLKEEAKSTPDSLLAAQLYQMVAEQLQQQKLALVEADFAFKVLENPAASDRPFFPSTKLVSGLTAIVVLVLSCLLLISRDWYHQIRRLYSTAAAAGRRRDGSTTR